MTCPSSWDCREAWCLSRRPQVRTPPPLPPPPSPTPHHDHHPTSIRNVIMSAEPVDLHRELRNTAGQQESWKPPPPPSPPPMQSNLYVALTIMHSTSACHVKLPLFQRIGPGCTIDSEDLLPDNQTLSDCVHCFIYTLMVFVAASWTWSTCLVIYTAAAKPKPCRCVSAAAERW